MTDSSDRLWGEPGDEHLHSCEVDAVDQLIDRRIHNDTPGDFGPWPLEEWTIAPPGDLIPTGLHIIEWMAEQATDEHSDDGDTYRALCDDTALIEQAETLAEAMATAMTDIGWRQAQSLVATHQVTATVHPDTSATIRLDGTPVIDLDAGEW